MTTALPRALWGAESVVPTSRCALTHGDSRPGNVLAALKLVEDDIRRGLAGKKRILIKPNLVTAERQRAATHVDCIEAILEFLQPIIKGLGEMAEVLIAESPASGPAAAAYSNYGYYKLRNKYKVKFLELDASPVVTAHMVDHRYMPHAIRFAQMLLDPDIYVISAAVVKTHDRAVATLALKNVAVGGPIKETGSGGRRGRSYKWITHGGKDNVGLHFNLFTLAKLAPPHLAVLDGYQAMEGNGPVGGDPVDHKIAIASADWLAADRVAVELMGIDFSKVGYLTLCAEHGLGQGDLARIEVRGESVADHIRSYQLHQNIESQYRWQKQ
jgi:uncharacterized protein (DUF362 family)